MTRQNAGSALLLTVMIIAVLMTTTLGAIAVRFDQLASTDRLVNSAVAKSAADAGLARLKGKLAATTAVTTTQVDLESFEESSLTSTKNFKPSPRRILTTYEKADTILPRCIAVGVLSPWTNDGQYLFQSQNTSNPALIFNYANIINDTALGTVNQDRALINSLSDAQKTTTISQLTNMGHFYNPFAPAGSRQGDTRYWTIKFGGPEDEFVSKKSVDGLSSFYKGLDLIYVPYLPRFQDSGIFTSETNTALKRIKGTDTDGNPDNDLRGLFEKTIKDNNFKVWLDASVTDAQLYQYGLGDLFVDSNDYRVSWLQPALWNDVPELDNNVPYIATNLDDTAGTINWTKQPAKLYTGGADTQWKTAIIKGAKSFSFIQLTANQDNTSLTPSTSEISGLLYGSLEGLRLQQDITLMLLDKNRSPLGLERRSYDQGKLYGVKLTKIGPTTTSNGIESTNITFRLGGDEYKTPKKANGTLIKGSDFQTVAILAGPQFSTKQSVGNVSIPATGTNATVTFSSATSCLYAQNSLTACPAVGDLVSLTKPSSPSTPPLWGMVKDVGFNPAGSAMISYTVDKLRQYPKPTRDAAYVQFNQGGVDKIAYYGGSIVMNDYDGGYNSESDELWIYEPESNNWVFKSNAATPGKRAGASMVYDSLNQRLVVTGGYYHEPVSDTAFDCEKMQPTCLYTNWANLRVAKRVSSDVFAYGLGTMGANTWQQITYPSAPKIEAVPYTLRVTSTLADRSGLERWLWNGKNRNASTPTEALNVNPGTSTDVTVWPSAAGFAAGDDLYISGVKATACNGNTAFSAWAKVNTVKFSANQINVSLYGYKAGCNEATSGVVLSSISMQVANREISAYECNGSTAGGRFACVMPNAAAMVGYGVGDSVVLERYNGNTIEHTLSGYISYIDHTLNAFYFVADEKVAGLNDFSSVSGAQALRDSGHSAVRLPSARYGGSLLEQVSAPSATTRDAVYYQGAVKNINNYYRYADAWKLRFTQNNAGADWTFITANSLGDSTSPTPNTSTNYRMQVVRSPYFGQVNSTGTVTATLNPQMIKDKQITDPITGVTKIVWDDNKYWTLEIDPAEQGKLVSGAAVTIEKQTGGGAREVFHGNVYNYGVGGASVPAGCGLYEGGNFRPERVCVRHSGGYAADSGFSENSSNVKISINSSFSTQSFSSSITAKWLAANDTWELTVSGNSLTNNVMGSVPPVGATVMMWDPAQNPKISGYTMVVSGRSYSGGSVVTLTPARRTNASPVPAAFLTNEVSKSTESTGVDRIVSIGEHLLPHATQGSGAPEWMLNINGVAGNPDWKIRIATKGALNDRPAWRRDAASVSVFDATQNVSKLYLTGGTQGVYSGLWRQNDSGKDTATAQWLLLNASPMTAIDGQPGDLLSMHGGTLAAYKNGSNMRGVFFGGKRKTDFSSADYGQNIGAYILGRPNIGGNDSSFYLPDNPASNTVDTWPFVKTLEENLDDTGLSWVPGSVGNALSLQGIGNNLWTNPPTCRFIGQFNSGGPYTNCPVYKQQLVFLGGLGRFGAGIGGGQIEWGKSLTLLNPGSKFRSQDGKPSAILSGPTLSGGITTRRWEQEGYTPYRCDTSAPGCLNLSYGRLATSFTSDKTLLFAGYTKLPATTTEGGAILVTPAGVGTTLTSARGSGYVQDTWYSYCAASDTKHSRDPDDYPIGHAQAFDCEYPSSKQLGWVPDTEDLVFMLNASLALASTDTYKVIGYYGGVKRGYLVISRGGSQPAVHEIVP